MREQQKDYLYNSNTQEKFFLIRRQTVIGRHPRCHVELKDRNVSGRHCHITVDSKNIYLTDLGSTNKTYINGKELTPHVPVKLSAWDNIKIGTQSFVYNRDGAVEKGTIHFSRRHLTLNLKNYVIEQEVAKNKKNEIDADSKRPLPQEKFPDKIFFSNKMLLLAEIQKILMRVNESDESLENYLDDIKNCMSILSGLEKEVESKLEKVARKLPPMPPSVGDRVRSQEVSAIHQVVDFDSTGVH